MKQVGLKQRPDCLDFVYPMSRGNTSYSQGKQCQDWRKNSKKEMQLFSGAGLLLKPPHLLTVALFVLKLLKKP